MLSKIGRGHSRNRQVSRRNFSWVTRISTGCCPLKLIIAGAVYGVAATKELGLLLVVPLISTTLCARFMDEARVVYHIARYIRKELGPRVPGGLGWESRLSRVERRSSSVRREPLLCAFGGVSAVALLWCAHHAFTQRGYPGGVVVACSRLAALVVCVVLIVRGEARSPEPRLSARPVLIDDTWTRIDGPGLDLAEFYAALARPGEPSPPSVGGSVRVLRGRRRRGQFMATCRRMPTATCDT